MKRFFSILLSILLIISITACSADDIEFIENLGQNISQNISQNIPTQSGDTELLASAYSCEPFGVVNDNIPYFTDAEKQSTEVFETYSELDSLGRCGVAYANIGRELMPTEDRESLSSVTPSGWKNKQYDIVDGGWIYNRAHIIGFQLAGEQANKLNLITGTRYFNVDGMLTFENMVADYIKETNNHVLYRVTPVFVGNNLVAEGVLMEGWSVEDNGDGICFNVFCYNVQPGIEIDYATGDSWLSTDKDTANEDENNTTYVLNTNTKKFHYETCSSAMSISENNKDIYRGDRTNLIEDGYVPCGVCKP